MGKFKRLLDWIRTDEGKAEMLAIIKTPQLSDVWWLQINKEQ